MLTLIALLIGIAVSVPLAVLLTRSPRLQTVVMAIISMIQTIPALALLAVMVPIIGLIGIIPAIVALTLYSMLPVVRNTVTGLQGVDPTYIEAARGLGMTDRQMLFQVQFPLAMPVIIAGVRTSTVWVVSIATLATAVGATSLGNYIFSGLQTRNDVAIVFGSVVAALLALGLDGVVRLLERAAEERRRGLAMIAGVALMFAGAGGAYPLVNDAYDYFVGSDQPRVRIGAKPFVEQFILSEALEIYLDNNGFDARRKESLGSTVLFDALRQNQLDVYIDYSGTIWSTQMDKTEVPDAETVLDEVTKWLKEEHDILCLGPLGFDNSYAFAMRPGQAQELGVETMTDVAQYDQRLSIGADYEFFERAEWEEINRTYDYNFDKHVTLDPALRYQAIDAGQVDVIAAYTTDGKLAAFELKLLRDDGGALPPYDAIVLLSPNAAKNTQLLDALDPWIGAISTDTMREANKIVDVDQKPVPAAAEFLLNEVIR